MVTVRATVKSVLLRGILYEVNKEGSMLSCCGVSCGCGWSTSPACVQSSGHRQPTRGGTAAVENCYTEPRNWAAVRTVARWRLGSG
jgi:hypothetical protein